MRIQKTTLGAVQLFGLLLALLWLSPCGNAQGIQNYRLDFSSYFGGSNIEHARDITADRNGNFYIAGGTESTDFPVTQGAYDTVRGGGGTSAGADDFDAFVAKFDSTGKPVWVTYLGGPNYDRIYAIEVDDQGYVYVAGRAGEGFPTTAGAFQPVFNGSQEGSAYGKQNGFAAKFATDGKLVWASYAGVGWGCRDLAIDADGDVYVSLPYTGSGPKPPQAWFANAFQPDVKGDSEVGVMKIKSDGSAVVWATWLGGTGKEHGQTTVRVDAAKNVYTNFMTESNDMPVMAGAHDSTLGGTQDGFVAKISPDGSRLLFATYVGGSGMEYMETHGLALDKQGNVYSMFATDSPDFPVTTASPFAKPNSGTNVGLVKLSPTGALLLATLYGGSLGEGPDGIYVEDDGDILIGGETGSIDLPLSPGAFDSILNGGRDGFFINLSADMTRLNYATYFGGASEANVRGIFAGIDGKVYLTGSTNGPGLSTLNAVQPNYGGGSGGCCAIGDALVARFSPMSSSSVNLSQYRRVHSHRKSTLPIPQQLWYRKGNPASPLEETRRFYNARGSVRTIEPR